MKRPGARTADQARSASLSLSISLVIFATLVPAFAWAEPSCKEALGAARGHLVAVRRTRESFLYYMKKARAALLEMPASCRDGAWYAAAASLLLQPENHGQPLVLADALRLQRPRDALEAGLSAAPKDPDLLALVAHLSRVAPDSAPALPADACGRLAGQDSPLRSYVCAVDALRAGREKEAARHLQAIPDPGKFPDVEALLLDALRRAGQGDEERRAADRMRKIVPHLSCDPFCPQVDAPLRRPPG